MKAEKKVNSDWTVYILFSIFIATFGGRVFINDIWLFSNILDFISNYIPSITVIERYSEYPTLSRRYFSFMWLTQPFMYIFYFKYPERLGVKNEILFHKTFSFILFLSVVGVACFIMNFYLLGSDYLLSVPRDMANEKLVMMGRLINQINYNRLTMGIIGGLFFMLMGYISSFLIYSIIKLRNRK